MNKEITVQIKFKNGILLSDIIDPTKIESFAIASIKKARSMTNVSFSEDSKIYMDEFCLLKCTKRVFGKKDHYDLMIQTVWSELTKEIVENLTSYKKIKY